MLLLFAVLVSGMLLILFGTSRMHSSLDDLHAQMELQERSLDSLTRAQTDAKLELSKSQSSLARAVVEIQQRKQEVESVGAHAKELQEALRRQGEEVSRSLAQAQRGLDGQMAELEKRISSAGARLARLARLPCTVPKPAPASRPTLPARQHASVRTRPPAYPGYVWG